MYLVLSTYFRDIQGPLLVNTRGGRQLGKQDCIWHVLVPSVQSSNSQMFHTKNCVSKGLPHSAGTQSPTCWSISMGWGCCGKNTRMPEFLVDLMQKNF